MTEFINRLAQLIVQDNAVLFVGAELRHEAETSLAIQQIAAELAARIQYQRSDLSLPTIARDFEVLKGRNELIMALREILAEMDPKPDLTCQLIADAVLPMTKVVTTRFDQILERALDQFDKLYVVIVRDTDVPFFDELKITLIKMQGDISQPDSLVITEDDIDAFISRLPTVSNVIRAFFATKTLIFLGYDLNSEQFKRLYRQVTRNLSNFRRKALAVVSQAVDEVEAQYWQGQNVEISLQEPLSFLETLAQAVKRAALEPRPNPNPLARIAKPTFDWITLLRASGASWTVFDTIVYNPNDTCANQYPGATRQNQVDLRGQVAFAYNEDNLYVAFLVDDEGFVSYNSNDERFFLGDAPQLLLDMNLAGDYDDDQVNQDDLQVDFHPGVRQPGLNARAALWQLETLTSHLFQAAQVGASPTNSGYFLEAALSWEELGFKPQPGPTLGAAASISDNDMSGTNNQECMISTAPQRDWQNPTTWGTLTLGASSGQTQ